MLRLIFNPKKAERHPLEVFFLAIVYSSFSILFAIWIFPNYASIAMIFLTVFSCLYLIQRATNIEEKKEISRPEKSLLKEHSKLISLLFFLFLGFTVSFTLWSFLLPVEKASSLFSFQETTVQGIRAAIVGSFSSSSTFMAILFNNLKVLLISLIFAVFYGAGAMYVLVWNASVMGFVIGTLARNTFGISALPISFAKYFIHGIPEMLAYLVTALAGGLIYSAIWRGNLRTEERKKKLMIDVLILVAASIFILIIAGLIEIYISPYI